MTVLRVAGKPEAGASRMTLQSVTKRKLKLINRFDTSRGSSVQTFPNVIVIVCEPTGELLFSGNSVGAQTILVERND